MSEDIEDIEDNEEPVKKKKKGLTLRMLEVEEYEAMLNALTLLHIEVETLKEEIHKIYDWINRSNTK